MLNSIIGNQILDGLFGKKNGATIIFSGDVYIGLLTKLPNSNCAAYEDGTYFSEPADSTYQRIKINTTSRIGKTKFIAGAELDEATTIDGCEAFPAYVTNQNMIMFLETSEEWDKVVGFGLFRSNNTNDTTTLPFLWGEVTAEDGTSGVSIGQYEVPIIRTGGFKVSLV